MYTHARQFPHLAGRSDGEIRALARSALDRRPNLRRVARVRNLVVLSGLAALTLYAISFAGTAGRDTRPGDDLKFGGLLMLLGGGSATVAVLLWNLVWVNTVLFRITREDLRPEPASGLRGSADLSNYDPFAPAADPDDWTFDQDNIGTDTEG